MEMKELELAEEPEPDDQNSLHGLPAFFLAFTVYLVDFLGCRKKRRIDTVLIEAGTVAELIEKVFVQFKIYVKGYWINNEIQPIPTDATSAQHYSGFMYFEF